MREVTKGKKVIGYVRVSRTMGREGDSFLSPALQREQIETLARREDITVVDFVEELDASGGELPVREGLASGLLRVASACRSRIECRADVQPKNAESLEDASGGG